VAIVCTPVAASGFALGGVVAVPAVDAAAAGDVLETLLALPAGERPAVLLVEEPLANGLPAPLRRRLGREPALLMVPFPSARAAAAAAPDAFLLELLRQAIGYRVRLA
jgi:vacuolar-type H+-ATPase subunit F/Vma7